MTHIPFSFSHTDAVPDGVIVVTDVTAYSAFLQWKDYEVEFGYFIISDPVSAVPDHAILTDPMILLQIRYPGTVINITVEDVLTQEPLANAVIRSGEYEVIIQSCQSMLIKQIKIHCKITIPNINNNHGEGIDILLLSKFLWIIQKVK